MNTDNTNCNHAEEQALILFPKSEDDFTDVVNESHRKDFIKGATWQANQPSQPIVGGVEVPEDKIQALYDTFTNWYQDDGSYDTFLQSEACKAIIDVAKILSTLPTSVTPVSSKGKDEWIDYKAKYEKCIDTIRKFDPGIIGMYDL